MLAERAGPPAREGQVSQETLVVGSRREGERGELVVQVRLAERDDLQASRKSARVELLEA